MSVNPNTEVVRLRMDLTVEETILLVKMLAAGAALVDHVNDEKSAFKLGSRIMRALDNASKEKVA